MSKQATNRIVATLEELGQQFDAVRDDLADDLDAVRLMALVHADPQLRRGINAACASLPGLLTYLDRATTLMARRARQADQ